MTFKRLQEISSPHYYCFILDKYFPKKLRGFLRYLSALLALISFGLSFDALPLYFGSADGLFFLFIFFYLLLSFLEFFYKSMKAEGLQVRIHESFLDNEEKLDFSLSSVLFLTDSIDATRAIFEADVGRQILLRVGISAEEAKKFIYSNRTPVIASSLNLEGESINLAEYMTTLYDADKSLQSFFSNNSINKEEFVGAVSWVMQTEDKKRRKERFWAKENLGAIPSIGTSWSYGVSAELGKYGIPFERSNNISLLDTENGYRDREVSALEAILERREEANAVIIDDDEKVAKDIVGRLAKRIKLGIAPPSIELKSIIELDYNSLVADFKNKGEFESELILMLNQLVQAGNVILYIRDLADFATSVKNIGGNMASLISPYLSSRSLQIIASATNVDFHFFIETSPALLERFERIIPDAAGVEASIGALLEKVPSIERDYEIIFSYPSILAVANSADKYVTYGEMPGKALDMMVEIAPWAMERKINILKENDVLIFASEKTGIAAGPIKEDEALKIENLEGLLHNRVVGQDEAVKGVADAIKRARSGVGNPKKPLSSFLFLGPTGVGKTEVSKALAENFFGDEKRMIRFDMSEFNGPDALSRLIGDYTVNRSGILASKVRDNPYSVLLLDEFEKAAPDVLDLFLQVLDEGIFTDALGKQVGCRNLIIIATSNAGSSFIWNAIKSGKELAGEKDNIVNEIIKEKIFKPELLNRFDGVILFHPLLNKELEGVARLGLEKLAKRLKEKNIELVVNEDIVNFLVEKGSDPQFGGRSINRAIQNDIENIVAQKIVSGVAKPGSKIELNKNDLS